MNTVLLILGIWLLLNVLFVVVMAPSRKPRKADAPLTSDTSFAPAKINKEANPRQEEEEISIRHVIISVGMGAFFALSLPIAEAIDSIKRALKRKPPAE
jgi:hypothetical protein